jgi:hypothetical protein
MDLLGALNFTKEILKRTPHLYNFKKYLIFENKTFLTFLTQRNDFLN